MKMSSCGRGCGSNPGQHGDVDNESERTGLDDEHDRDQTPGTNAGAGDRTNGRQLTPEQARVAGWYRGRRRRRAGAPVAGPAKAPELRAGWPATTSATGTSVRRWPPSIRRWTTLSRKRRSRRRSKAGRRNSACRNAWAVSFDPIHFVPARSRRSPRRRRKSRKNRTELRFSLVSFWTRVFPFFNCAQPPVQKRLLW